MNSELITLLKDARLNRTSEPIKLNYQKLFDLANQHQISALIYNQIYNFVDFPEEIKQTVKRNIVDAYRGIMKETPLGDELRMGVLSMHGTTMKSIVRNEWETPDHIAILYSLYKYIEANAELDGERNPEQYMCTLTQLFMKDENIPGVSPAHIFSLEREHLKKIVSGLAVEYPEFISISFTHDLENISLSPEKSSEDVLTVLSSQKRGI